MNESVRKAREISIRLAQMFTEGIRKSMCGESYENLDKDIVTLIATALQEATDQALTLSRDVYQAVIKVKDDEIASLSADLAACGERCGKLEAGIKKLYTDEYPGDGTYLEVDFQAYLARLTEDKKEGV